MAKKVVTRKKHGDGPEAPLNKLKPPVEISQGLRGGGDKVRNNFSERKQNASEVPIKKLIDQEISSRKHPKKNVQSPSVVARLMGVDMLPSHENPAPKQVEKKYEAHRSTLINENIAKNDSIGHLNRTSKSARQKRSISLDSVEENSSDLWSYDKVQNKPRKREHPQEEELQKFKEEFETWLAERVKKCTKTIELGKTPSQWLARENLNREKMVFYENSKTMTENVKPREPKGGSLETNCHDRVGLQSKTLKKKYSAQEIESFYLKKKNENDNVKRSFHQNSDQLADVDLAPSKIVILRPGPDSIGSYEECFSSPGTSRESTSIEEFLEEVKGRLKFETMGKTCKKAITSRGGEGGFETPFNEYPSDPKQIAQRIAKHVRESVTRDLGMSLFRSESTRSYRSDLYVNETDDPEFISRDTRKILVERLKNVMKEETHQHDPVVHESKRSSMLSYQRNRMQKSRDVSNSKNKSRPLDSLENGSHMQSSRSLRRKDNGKEEIQEESSPRNLIRSLSAPVSGTSFGKLLLEDRHMLTGAHIRRKHEATEKATTKVNEKKKEKFNLKEKVTSLKQSITLKGKLFGRKSHSSEEEHGNGHDIIEENPSRSSILTSFYDQPEDYTEVPPSPASLSSCIHEVSMLPAEHFSSTSISDEASTDDNLNPKAFMEISSNLKELRRQLNVSDSDASEDTMLDEQPIEANLPEIEDQAEAYIRDLLIVSGLYDGSIYQSLSRLEPISIQVYEEVEESFRHKINDNEGSRNDQYEKINHKMLFDLLNETLPRLLGPPLPISKYTTSPMTQTPPRGKKLLDQVWQIIRVYVHPATERAQHSLDTMLARDMKSSSWYTLMDDDVNDLVKDIECQIIGDLIGEMVKDMLPKRRARRKA